MNTNNSFSFVKRSTSPSLGLTKTEVDLSIENQSIDCRISSLHNL